MANTSIQLVGLDFNSIKSNLKSYLKNNSAFKDVDFEGSNINVLIDLLSYNTYMNAFYTNMVASEMFIDTAQLRDSVTSHAKMLNYTPRSFVSSKALINLSVTPSSNVTNVLIPKGTTFTSRVGSNTYTFSTNESLVLTNPNNNVYKTQLDIYEGNYVTDSFVMNYSNTTQRFVISNPTVDVSSLGVTVVEDSGNTFIDYNKTETLIGLNSQSKVFFVQGAENQQYEIIFGDGIFGRKPKDGAVIIAEYRNSSGELPNGAATFLNDGNIDGHANVTITTITISSGGSINESTESIKYNAPRYFQTQGRAVTTKDYETLLSINFPEIENISAYGGEQLVPPQFGKVFIAVDVRNVQGTPYNRIRAYQDFIKDKTPVSIEAVFVDPEFSYLKVDCNVKYNINATNKLSNDIKTLVSSSISNFNINNLNTFSLSFYYSKFINSIDESDNSILGNDTTVKLYKKIVPQLQKESSFSISYGVSFERESGVDVIVSGSTESHYGHTISSSAFSINDNPANRYIFVDDTNGILYLAKLTGTKVELKNIVGTVNYLDGIVNINKITFGSYEGSGVKIYAKTLSKDITTTKNIILSIIDEDVNVVVTPVKV